VKIGDLVWVDGDLYPRLKKEVGMLVELRMPRSWIVMIAGRLHPFVISQEDMELASASR